MSSQTNAGRFDDNFRVKVEFAVNITKEDELEEIKKALKNKVSNICSHSYNLTRYKHD